MGLSDYIKKLQKLVLVLGDDELLAKRIGIPATLAVEAEYKVRIFKEGEATNGSNIGKYSNTPFYAGKDSLKGLPKGKFKPVGKNGRSRFKNGKPKKTRYLKGGYGEFRDRAGRQSKNVDLNLTGASERSIRTGLKGSKVVLGFTSKERFDILRGNEKRFKKDILTLSKKERVTFIDAAEREISFLIRQQLNTSG
jgi:hypothetical protein